MLISRSGTSKPRLLLSNKSVGFQVVVKSSHNNFLHCLACNTGKRYRSIVLEHIRIFALLKYGNNDRGSPFSWYNTCIPN
ncbi:hypothetical protein CEXT_214601 [Caerostris extrusa]|uniref:Uncharacterized protein n=1 Tax=Caerostris extrusa TaxID=172846 RepID=A0AAV4M652_CAEEX|nr:hypothetical protein CEXT_214601 [Caerostris extrusa]